MFKSARYFFLVFLVTTVIPLFLMFLWTNKRMEMMHQDKKNHFLSIGTQQLENMTTMYLQVQEARVLREAQNIEDDISKTALQRFFPDSDVKIIHYSDEPEIRSYYELFDKKNGTNPELFSVVTVPLKSGSDLGLQISQKVDMQKIRPFGPFYIELYKGDKISQESFIMEMPIPNDMPPPPEFEGKHKPKEKHIYEDIEKHYSKVNLYGSDGEAVVAFAFRHFDDRFQGPPGTPHPLIPPRQENNFGLVILLAGSTLSLIVGVYIHNNFIKPVIMLADASKKVQNGDLSFSLKTDVKHKEIQNTYKNFNQMIFDLKEKEELRKSFILNLTHDLRTPLIAQERSLSMIANRFEMLGLKDEFELSSSLEQNNKHLLRMVNLILESYSFDSEKINLSPKPTDLSEVVGSCYEKLMPLAREKNINLINNIPSDFPRIVVDETCMKRVFLNLVSNAIENIAQNGQIKISAQTEDGFAKIMVEDDGCGISPKDLLHIFDRYYSGKSLDRKLGSGLGLDVCRKLVEMHNGKISVESEVNNYTRFIVQLPVGKI